MTDCAETHPTLLKRYAVAMRRKRRRLDMAERLRKLRIISVNKMYEAQMKQAENDWDVWRRNSYSVSQYLEEIFHLEFTRTYICACKCVYMYVYVNNFHCFLFISLFSVGEAHDQERYIGRVDRATKKP
jgi:hypothetical protein